MIMTMLRTVNLSLTAELLDEIDAFRRSRYASRSEYIRHAVIEQLRHDTQVSERQFMPKKLPRKYLVNSLDDEYGMSDEYDM